MHDKTISGARGVLPRCYAVPWKGKTSGKVFSVPDVCQTDESEGKGCMFAMLGMCGGPTDRVFGFVSSFSASFM